MGPVRQFSNQPDPMDLWLESQGYYRKITARDGSSLFRAIAEQVFSTQRYHSEVRKQCLEYLTEHQDIFTEFDLEESVEEYLQHLQNPTQWGGPIEVAVFSKLYKLNILVFKEVGVQPLEEKCAESEKTIMLCSSQNHYDSVYHKDYTKVAGYCQSLVYEVLYKTVFMMKDVDYAVDKMLHYKPMRHRSDQGLGSPRKFLSFNCSSLQMQRKGIEDMLDSEVNVRELLNKGITPFPYKVAKSLDPNIFRNVEFDVWVDYRRGLRFGYFDSNSELRVGVKCLVKLSDGTGYVGHIQEMAPDKGPVVLFVEEFGEKRTVPFEWLQVLPQEAPSTQGNKHWTQSLHGQRSSPSPSSKQSSSSTEQGGKGRKGRDVGESRFKGGQASGTRRSRKTSQSISGYEGSDVNGVGSQQCANLLTYGASSSPESYIAYPNYQVDMDRSLQYPILPPTGSPSVSPIPRHPPLLLPLSPSPDDVSYRFAPLTFPDPKDSARLGSTSVSPSGPVCPTDYFHFVYDSSPVSDQDEPAESSKDCNSNYTTNDAWKNQMQINFNAPKSVMDNGADLPMSDIQTLRFFYNLGNDVYRAQCYSWNGAGPCSPGCAAAAPCASKSGNNGSSDNVLQTQDSTQATGSRRRPRRETTASSPGGVSMTESETGDFSTRVANPAPAFPSQTSHLSPRFKKDGKTGGKSKGKEGKADESSAPKHSTQSLSSKRSADSAARLEPLVLNDSTKDSGDQVLSPLAIPYGYVCYPNSPVAFSAPFSPGFSPADSDPNMFFSPTACRIQYPEQCYSPVSDVNAQYPLYSPSATSHFIFPASPGVYVGAPTPTWASMTPPTPQ